MYLKGVYGVRLPLGISGDPCLDTRGLELADTGWRLPGEGSGPVRITS